jgi:Protein of unknown function (DUF1761)
MKINFPAVIVSAIAYWILGAVWYGLLFTNQFVSLMHLTPQQLEDMQKRVPAKEYSLAFLSGLIMSAVLAWLFSLIKPKTALQAAGIAALLWCGFVLTTTLDTVLFESRPLGLYLINNGYHLVGLLLVGLILGSWRAKPALAPEFGTGTASVGSD